MVSQKTLAPLKLRHSQAEKFSPNISVLKGTKIPWPPLTSAQDRTRNCHISLHLWEKPNPQNIHCRMERANQPGSVYSRPPKYHQSGWKCILVNYLILRDENVPRFRNCWELQQDNPSRVQHKFFVLVHASFTLR